MPSYTTSIFSSLSHSRGICSTQENFLQQDVTLDGSRPHFIFQSSCGSLWRRSPRSQLQSAMTALLDLHFWLIQEEQHKSLAVSHRCHLLSAEGEGVCCLPQHMGTGSSCLTPMQTLYCSFPYTSRGCSLWSILQPWLVSPSIYSPCKSLQHTLRASLLSGYEIAAVGSFPLKNNPSPEGSLSTQ